jgi:deoxyribodipyrimidine photo-lyase
VGGACNIIKDWSKDEEKIERWKTGNTGQPLVDANMRELLYTGR